MKIKYCVMLPALSLLSACGGGGSSSSSPIVVPPTATPTPTTPVTPVSPDYANIFDLSVSALYSSPMAEASYRQLLPDTQGTSTTHVLTTDPNAATLRISSSPLSLLVTAQSQDTNFPEAGITSRDDKNIIFTGDRQASLYFSRGLLDLKYVGSWDLTETTRNPSNSNDSTTSNKFFIFGNETKSNDGPNSNLTFDTILKSSTVSYDGATGFAGRANLSFDVTTNRISGEFSAYQAFAYQGNPQVRAKLNFSGFADLASNRISGTVTSSDSSYRGQFTGRFYGPRGTDIGLLFVLDSDNGGVVGSLVGTTRISQ